MSELTLPIILAVAGVLVAIFSYRGIRRGGARYYTLEREALLRRSSLMLVGAVVLLLAAIGLLAYRVQQDNIQEAAESGELIEGFSTATPAPAVEQFPPTPTPSRTPDPDVPTVTPTAVVRRALVGDTFGNGLTLRDSPNGEQLEILLEGSALTLLDVPPEEVGGFLWVKVRTLPGEEGWVAEDFLIISER